MNLLETYSRFFTACFLGLLVFVLLMEQCFKLFAIPSEKYLEEQDTFIVSPTNVVAKSRGKTRSSKNPDYFVKYSNGTYEVLVEATSQSQARSTVSAKESRHVTLYLSTKDPDVYRLVFTSTTLKKSLQEERNPILLQGGVYLLLFIINVRDAIVNRIRSS